jgi:hypothetical protein
VINISDRNVCNSIRSSRSAGAASYSEPAVSYMWRYPVASWNLDLI